MDDVVDEWICREDARKEGDEGRERWLAAASRLLQLRPADLEGGSSRRDVVQRLRDDLIGRRSSASGVEGFDVRRVSSRSLQVR